MGNDIIQTPLMDVEARERTMSRQLGNVMLSEIAERYSKVYERWENEYQDFPPPLKFEVPEHPSNRTLLADHAFFGDSIINEHRCYAENMGSKRRWLTVAWGAASVCAGGTVLLSLVGGLNTPMFFGLPNWIWFFIYVAVGGLAYWYRPRMKRASSHIFDRDEGKIYINGGKGFPHFAFGFYDCYFFIQGGHADHVRHASLHLYVPKFTWKGKEQGGFPMRMAFTGSEQEALMAWYFLVRYMDKSWPFDTEEYEYFDYVRKEKERYGYKVEGIRYEDGRVEVL